MPNWLVAGLPPVTTAVVGVIVNASVWVPVPPALVALRVTVEAPAVVGVPEMSPVVALSARPADRNGAVKRVGLFVAVRRTLRCKGNWPVAVAALVKRAVV